MRKLTLAALTAASVSAALMPPPALAEEHEHWRGEIHRFHEHDLPYWRGGQWLHGPHEGRLGWWWVVGGIWYYYPAPVYPYPDPYRPPAVVIEPQPSGQYWYYCNNPAGYYPYVTSCFTPWQAVPASAQPPQPVPPQPMMPPPASGQYSPEPSGGLDKTTGGTLLGAAGGGLLGSQLGHGSGNLAATAIGTLLGAFIGHEVGQSLDQADSLAARQAEQSAYQAPLGHSITWNSPQTGHTGNITPVRDGQDSTGNYCREFQQNVTVNGRSEQAVGTACRQPDGTWKVLGQ